MDDKTIRHRYIRELDVLPQVDAAHIGVSVADSVVTLTGYVTTYAEKLAAERAAMQVPGVQAVAEQVEVRSPEHLRVGDEELADRCARVLAWDTTIPPDSVIVKVEKGSVTLSGWVQHYDQKTAADRALRRLAGVTDIVNTVGVRHPASDQTATIRHKDEIGDT